MRDITEAEACDLMHGMSAAGFLSFQMQFVRHCLCKLDRHRYHGRWWKEERTLEFVKGQDSLLDSHMV